MKPNLMAATALLILPGGLPAQDSLDIGSKELSQMEVHGSLDDFVPSKNEFRIYFIGDSITMHGFNEDTVERLKWGHTAGMAASSQDKDYAHLLADAVGSRVDGKPVRLFFGKGGDPRSALAGLSDAIRFQPSLVVVQLGEHVDPEDSAEKIEKDYAALLSALQQLTPPPIIIATGVWNPQLGQKSYSDRTALIDTIQSRVCQEMNISFASVEQYALDPACSGTGGSPGVKWHPNDAGHAGYAKELLKGFLEATKRE